MLSGRPLELGGQSTITHRVPRVVATGMLIRRQYTFYSVKKQNYICVHLPALLCAARVGDARQRVADAAAALVGADAVSEVVGGAEQVGAVRAHPGASSAGAHREGYALVGHPRRRRRQRRAEIGSARSGRGARDARDECNQRY